MTHLPHERETIGTSLNEWWNALSADSRRRVYIGLGLITLFWLAGTLHAPTTVDGIARLNGIWRWLLALCMGPFSFLWRLLEHTGKIQETMARPNLLYLPLVAISPGALFGLYWLLSQEADPLVSLRRRLQRMDEAQGRVAPEKIADKMAIRHGIPLVQVRNRKKEAVTVGYSREEMEGHILVVAPTRTGKGLHLTETLLRYPGPALVVDPKLEQFRRTAAYRQHIFGSPIYCLPGNTLPLAGYYGDLLDPDEARELHAHLVQPWSSREPIFAQKSESLFKAAGHFGQVVHSDPLRLLLDLAQSDVVQALTALQSNPDARRQVQVFTNAQKPATLGQDRFVTSAWGTFTTRLGPYQKHINTIAPLSDRWCIPREWVRQGATIFITYTLEEMETVNGLVSAIVAALLRYQTQRQRKDRLLVAIDEMPAVNLHNLEKYLTTTAGYGITLLLYAQSVSQLKKIYDPNGYETIINSCLHQLWYPAGDVSTARWMSERYGTTLKDLPAHAESQGTRRAAGGQTGAQTNSRQSHSVSWQEGPALTPNEMMALPRERVLAVTGPERSYVFLGERINPIPHFAELKRHGQPALSLASPQRRTYSDWLALAALARAEDSSRRAAAESATTTPQEPSVSAAEGPAVKRSIAEETAMASEAAGEETTEAEQFGPDVDDPFAATDMMS